MFFGGLGGIGKPPSFNNIVVGRGLLTNPLASIFCLLVMSVLKFFLDSFRYALSIKSFSGEKKA